MFCPTLRGAATGGFYYLTPCSLLHTFATDSEKMVSSSVACRSLLLLNEEIQPTSSQHYSTPEERVDLKDIKAIIDLMKKNSISEFELERQDFKIKLKRGNAQIAQNEDAAAAVALPVATATAALPVGVASPVPAVGEVEIKSPMIGTLYRGPSPESANYVEIGTEVNADSVVCIIEAMKVMNEIKAEIRGVVTEILIDNAKPVEFGQPMFRIRPL